VRNDESLREEIERWQAILEKGTFEELLTALEETVHTLEIGRLPLDTTVRVYELGTQLAQRCEQLLEQAELRVSQIGAAVSTEPLDDFAAEAAATEEIDADEEGAGEFPF
jgi:exodeoxyribonuclease VII small subunit